MMSFSDVDYGEARDERESKTFRLLKNILKWTVYGLSALVWILILFTVFSTRESKIYEQMLFTEATEEHAKQTEEYRVHQVYIQDFMNDSGDIALSSNSCYYAPETGELTVGIRYNKKLTGSDTTDSILYVLKDQDGNEYPAVIMDEDEIGRYGYARVCFTGLSLPLAEIDSQSKQTGDGSFVLTLTLYSIEDGTLLSSYTAKEGQDIVEINDSDFVLFDADSPSRMADFED